MSRRKKPNPRQWSTCELDKVPVMIGARGQDITYRPIDLTFTTNERWETQNRGSVETFFDPNVEEVRENPPRDEWMEVVGQKPVPLEQRIREGDERLRFMGHTVRIYYPPAPLRLTRTKKALSWLKKLWWGR